MKTRPDVKEEFIVLRKFISFVLVAVSAALVSCGGGGGTIAGGGGGGGVDAAVATVELLASSATLDSDTNGLRKVTLTAVIKNSGNAIIDGATVNFTTSSGSLTVLRQTTDATGTALAELTNGTDPTNRTITVTATANGVSDTVTVNVIGATLVVDGPNALALGDIGSYTATLRDAAGVGISGRLLTATSAQGNTVSSTSLVTNTSGQVSISLTATAGGVDTLTVGALGLTALRSITVSSDVFTIITPTASTEIPLNTPTAVTVRWTKNGTAQVGETITFSSTRGTLSAGSAVTDAAGEASVTISSTNAGGSVISATNDESVSTSVSVEFIATVPATVSAQASTQNVGIGQQSTVTATVRDAANNLVKNQTVVFDLTDVTGGVISVGSAVTDSQGRAQTVYTAGSSVSAVNGVSITATVGALSSTVTLTVVGAAIDMALGSGDTINLPAQSLYSKEWSIIVTDTSGTAPVANQTLQASVRSTHYRKGFFQLVDDGTGDLDWAQFHDSDLGDGVTAVAGSFRCADEDANVDGILSPAEDLNGNANLDAGNRATLVALAPGASSNACASLTSFGGPTTSVQTDASGIARICVVYLRSDNLWVDVELRSQLTVSGTEFTETANFILEALASDIEDEDSSVSGQISPFGTEGSCTDPD